MNTSKTTRLRRYARKQCQRCGKANPDYPLINCKRCSRMANDCRKRMIARWITAGLCRCCGGEREDKDKKICRQCRTKYNEWNQRSYKDKRKRDRAVRLKSSSNNLAPLKDAP